MVAAIDAVKGGESVLRAAKQFGVPRQTLEPRTKAVSNVCRREGIIELYSRRC